MAFDTDDAEPLTKPKTVLRDLTDMSIADLNEYVAELELEIERVKADIAAKSKARAAADALFKSPSS